MQVYLTSIHYKRPVKHHINSSIVNRPTLTFRGCEVASVSLNFRTFIPQSPRWNAILIGYPYLQGLRFILIFLKNQKDCLKMKSLQTTRVCKTTLTKFEMLLKLFGFCFHTLDLKFIFIYKQYLDLLVSWK